MPLDWQTIRKLLLVWTGDFQSATIQLDSVYSILQAALPQTTLWLLTCEPTEYQLHHISGTQVRLEHCCSQALMELIACLSDRSFDAAILFTQPGESPHQFAYLCYLANIPHRIGQSVEFGGGVLSWSIEPPADPVSLIDYHLHLLATTGLFYQSQQPIHSPCI